METVALIVVVAMFILGAPLFAVLFGAAFVGGATLKGGLWAMAHNQLTKIYKIADSHDGLILSSIPLFILAGVIMSESKTADRLLRVAKAWYGWIPGGLGIVTIFACAVFTIFTGASGVTIVALGGLLYPALIKERYPERFSLGIVGGTGSVGLLFPPALPLLIYAFVYIVFSGALSSTSAGDGPTLAPFEFESFVVAGIVPGFVLVGIMSIYVVLTARKNKVPRHQSSWAERWHSLGAALPELIVPPAVILGIIKGFSIAELASLTLVYVVILEVIIFKDVALPALASAFREAMTLTGAIFIIILSATALTQYLIDATVPQKLLAFIEANFQEKWSFLLALNIFLLFVGMLMDIYSAIVIVVPLLILPAAKVGVDPYHLGIIFLLNLEVGYLTPPVGLNLFITSFKFERPVLSVARATLPFLVCMVIALALVTSFEWLVVRPPEPRTGTTASLMTVVREGHQASTGTQSVKLSDGTTLERSKCPGFDGPRKQWCEDMFLEYDDCEAKPAAEQPRCREVAIRDYEEREEEEGDIELELDPPSEENTQ